MDSGHDAKVLRFLSYVVLAAGIGWAVAVAMLGTYTTMGVAIPGAAGFAGFGFLQIIAAIFSRGK